MKKLLISLRKFAENVYLNVEFTILTYTQMQINDNESLPFEFLCVKHAYGETSLSRQVTRMTWLYVRKELEAVPI